MPIYEYACDTCQVTFERKQKFSDDPIQTCPDCGNDVRRVLYPAGIIFKGSGFYSTDNRASSSASSTSSTSSSNSASTEGSSSNGANSDTGTSKAESSTTSKTSSAAADS
jgi:putative FmdB family regulatory protein